MCAYKRLAPDLPHSPARAPAQCIFRRHHKHQFIESTTTDELGSCIVRAQFRRLQEHIVRNLTPQGAFHSSMIGCNLRNSASNGKSTVN